MNSARFRRIIATSFNWKPRKHVWNSYLWTMVRPCGLPAVHPTASSRQAA